MLRTSARRLRGAGRAAVPAAGLRARATLALLAASVLVGGLTYAPSPGASGLVAGLAALAAAVLAVQVAGTARVPARVRTPATTWPGHPPRRAGGDLPRQQHPDSSGRSRPRAPGGR